LWCWWFEFSSDGCVFWVWGGGGGVVEEKEREREREREREDMVTNMQIMHYA
jgi:hypothetical protein